MKRIAVALWLWIILDMHAIAAQINSSPNTNATSINQCTIPFRKLYKLLTVEATINGISGYLCIDTGIEGLVMNEKYLRKSESGQLMKSIGGKTVEFGQTQASVQLACLSMEFYDAQILNIDHLVPSDNIPVLGLIGWAFFKGFDLQIDFRNKEFIVVESGNNKLDPPFPNASLLTLPLAFIGSVPIVQAKLGKRTMNLILDTGATVNVLDKSLYNSLKPYYNVLGSVKVREWSGQDADVPLTAVSGLLLGDLVLNPMNTVWYDLSGHYTDVKDYKISGVIGQELMKQYLLKINFESLEVSLYDYGYAQR